MGQLKSNNAASCASTAMLKARRRETNWHRERDLRRADTSPLPAHPDSPARQHRQLRLGRDHTGVLQRTDLVAGISRFDHCPFGGSRVRMGPLPPHQRVAPVRETMGGSGSALLLPDNLVEQTFVAFVIGGMCAASLVAFSNYLPAFIAYVFPASLPLAGRFFFDGWTVHGDMMVVFAVTITLAACNSPRGFVHGLRLNCDLTEKTKALVLVNQRLHLEVEQRRAAEDQLRQIHKKEAVGQLTGGIAHDFNNLLTVIVGHLEMAQDRVGADPRAVAWLQAALNAAERGVALTRHLLAFARRQHLDPRPVDIPGVLSAAERLLEQTIGPEIELVIRSELDLHPAWIDPKQLEPPIPNPALNAPDAMPGGGVLRS